MNDSNFTVAAFETSARLGDPREVLATLDSGCAERDSGTAGINVPTPLARKTSSACGIARLLTRAATCADKNYIDPARFDSGSGAIARHTWSGACATVQATGWRSAVRTYSNGVVRGTDWDFWRLHTRFDANAAMTAARVLETCRYKCGFAEMSGTYEWVSSRVSSGEAPESSGISSCTSASRYIWFTRSSYYGCDDDGSLATVEVSNRRELTFSATTASYLCISATPVLIVSSGGDLVTSTTLPVLSTGVVAISSGGTYTVDLAPYCFATDLPTEAESGSIYREISLNIGSGFAIAPGEDTYLSANLVTDHAAEYNCFGIFL